jgi:hypothetical protein
MSEQLFTLCNLQLGALIEDLDRSFETVNHAASRIIQNHTPAATAPNFTSPEHSQQTDELHLELRQIITGLQFHDELTQRLNHIQTLLKLIQEKSTVVVNPEFDTSMMLSTVAEIFSSSAEFTQLGKVFPEFQSANAVDAVELF